MALLCPPPHDKTKRKRTKLLKRTSLLNSEAVSITEPMRNRQERFGYRLALAPNQKSLLYHSRARLGRFFYGLTFTCFFFLSFSIVKTNCADARGSGAHFWKSPFKRSLGAHFLQTRVCLFFACCGTVLLQGFCLLWPLFVARIFACCGTFLFALQLQTFLFVSKEGKAALHLKPTACF